MEMIHKIGRRKTAVARVYLSTGKGKITINQRDISEYFPTATLQYKVRQPFALTDNVDNFDVKVNVYGGGITGQAEAIRLGLSRALCTIDEENRTALKPEGLLTQRSKNGGKKEIRTKEGKEEIPILQTLISDYRSFCKDGTIIQSLTSSLKTTWFQVEIINPIPLPLDAGCAFRKKLKGLSGKLV